MDCKLNKIIFLSVQCVIFICDHDDDIFVTFFFTLIKYALFCIFLKKKVKKTFIFLKYLFYSGSRLSAEC